MPQKPEGSYGISQLSEVPKGCPKLLNEMCPVKTWRTPHRSPGIQLLSPGLVSNISSHRDSGASGDGKHRSLTVCGIQFPRKRLNPNCIGTMES